MNTIEQFRIEGFKIVMRFMRAAQAFTPIPKNKEEAKTRWSNIMSRYTDDAYELITLYSNALGEDEDGNHIDGAKDISLTELHMINAIYDTYKEYMDKECNLAGSLLNELCALYAN